MFKIYSIVTNFANLLLFDLKVHTFIAVMSNWIFTVLMAN